MNCPGRNIGMRRFSGGGKYNQTEDKTMPS